MYLIGCHLICLAIRDWNSWSVNPHKRLSVFVFRHESLCWSVPCHGRNSKSESPDTNRDADNYTYTLGTKKYIQGATQKFPDYPRGALTGSISPVRHYTPDDFIYYELVW